jgi:hypothetical protein
MQSKFTIQFRVLNFHENGASLSSFVFFLGALTNFSTIFGEQEV